MTLLVNRSAAGSLQIRYFLAYAIINGRLQLRGEPLYINKTSSSDYT